MVVLIVDCTSNVVHYNNLHFHPSILLPIFDLVIFYTLSSLYGSWSYCKGYLQQKKQIPSELIVFTIPFIPYYGNVEF